MKYVYVVVFALIILFIFLGYLRHIALRNLHKKKIKPCAKMQYESEYFNLFDDPKSRESVVKEIPILPP